MFDNIINFFKKFSKDTKKDSKDTAKERLHLVLMQDRANVSADFLEMMKQEIIEVIKKYIDVDENSIDVKLTNKVNSDGTTGAPALYANIPIVSLKDETKKVNIERKKANKNVEEKTTETEKEELTVNEETKKETDNKADNVEVNNSKTNKETKKEDVKEDVGAKSVRNTKEQDPISHDENEDSKLVENTEDEETNSPDENTQIEDVEIKPVDNAKEQDKEVAHNEDIEPKKEDVEGTENSEKIEVE